MAIPKIRAGNDFVYVWAIERNGVAVDLTAATTVRLSYGVGKPCNYYTEIPFAIIDGNKVRSSHNYENTGTYNLRLEFTMAGVDSTVDIDAFAIVPRSSLASEATDFAVTSDMAIGFKGDPFTYDDFTPEQIAELQQPATDAILSIQAVELAVETAEGLRVQAELNRQSDTATAISNAEQATDEANDAAILANDAAILANEKAGLAATATTQANAARDLANEKAGLADTAATNADDARLAIANELALKVDKSAVKQEVNNIFLIDGISNNSILNGDLKGSTPGFIYGSIDASTPYIKDNYHLKEAIYPQYNATNGADVDVVRLLCIPKVTLDTGKYIKVCFYVLSKNEAISPYTSLVRITAGSPAYAVILKSNTKIDNNTWLRYYETNPVLNSLYDGLSEIYIYHYIKNFTGYSKGDYIFFGFSVYESVNSTFENENLIPSWDFIIKEELRKLKDNSVSNDKELNVRWNNVGYNRAYASSFLRKKQRKEVDEFNELNVTLMGTSSFGREYSADTSSVNDYPLSPLGDRYGINEEYQNITYYLRQILKFENEDVVFSPAVKNLSELTKIGTFSTHETNDFVKLLRCNTIDNSIELNVTGYNFVKVYISGVADVYIDNVLIERINLSSPTDGKSVNKRYILNENTSFKIVSVNTSNLDIWGFERWNNPKVSILNNAVGGTLSDAFLHYKKWSKGLDLATYQIPGGNDTSITNATYFKGKKEPNSAGITTGLNFFIYANITGTYVNYGNLFLNKGEYAEWNGTSWVRGSTKVKADLDYWYNNMKTLLDNVLPTGCPHIGIVQHRVSWIDDRPWQWDIIKLSRSMWQERGVALIDIFDKSEELGSFLADGTHYKHNMALSYAEEYARIFNFNLEPYYTENYLPYVTNSLKSDVIEANASYTPSKLNGNSSSNSVVFNIPFNSIPKVRIYNNNSIVISSVTKEGFTITGSGYYEWEAYIL